jgi:hypothetical protein
LGDGDIAPQIATRSGDHSGGQSEPTGHVEETTAVWVNGTTSKQICVCGLTRQDGRSCTE